MGLFAVRDIPRGSRILMEEPVLQMPKPFTVVDASVQDAFDKLDSRAQFYIQSLLPQSTVYGRICDLAAKFRKTNKDRQYYLEWPLEDREIHVPSRQIWESTREDPWAPNWQPEGFLDDKGHPDVSLIEWESEDNS